MSLSDGVHRASITHRSVDLAGKSIGVRSRIPGHPCAERMRNENSVARSFAIGLGSEGPRDT